MSLRSVILLSILLYSGILSAQKDSASVLGRIISSQLPAQSFVAPAGHNPAIRYQMYDTSLTELSVWGECRQTDQPVLLQEGDGWRGYAFDASSFRKIDATASVWGSAYYKNGTRTNVKRNESSDFSVVYPYVMADSIGGDLFSEEYSFSGGYAHRSDRITWGVEGSYRALMEYRNVDPRPRNICSDLNLSAGLSMALSAAYTAGASLFLQKYKQTNKIDFYSELGAAKVYHFTGLGMDYTRFSGGMTDTYYNGQAYGVSAQLMPAGKEGFYSSILYNRFSVEKIISSLNELPLADISEQTLSAQLAYRWQKEGQEQGVKATFLYKNRVGTENLFGDPVSNIYPQIAEVEQYGSRHTGVQLSAFHSSSRFGVYQLFLMPAVGYESLKMSYKYPIRFIEHSAVIGSFTTELLRKQAKSLLRLAAGFSYSKALDSRMRLDGIGEGGVKQMLQSNYTFLSSDVARLRLSPRYDYLLPGNRALFVKAEWVHGWHARHVSSDCLQLSLGIAF